MTIALGAATPTVGGTGPLTLSGVISDGAGNTLTKVGAGTLNLTGANNYTGLTTVSAGTLSAGNATALGTTAAGTTVTWTNTDAVAHTSTSDLPGWNSGVVAPGGQFSFAFQTAGTFAYHCTIHPGMVGTVVVH